MNFILTLLGLKPRTVDSVLLSFNTIVSQLEAIETKADAEVGRQADIADRADALAEAAAAEAQRARRAADKIRLLTA